MNTPTVEAIENEFVTIPEIMEETGATYSTVHGWLRYHQYMPVVYLLGKPVTRRSDFEQFKREHPELIQAKAAA